MNIKSELKEKLKERYLILKKSCERYDAGEVEEIMTIAVSLRIILDDHGRQKSLLAQISREFGIKSKILTHSNLQDASKYTFYLNIRMNHADGSTTFVPRMDLSNEDLSEITVPSWMSSVVVKANEMSLTRGDLVLGMSNKDGGAHVHLDEKSPYMKLTRSNLPFEFGSQKTLDMGKFQNASVRESAFYVLNMLDKYFHEIIK
jgi:hypothetical protein